jgi:hypothetical protein
VSEGVLRFFGGAETIKTILLDACTADACISMEEALVPPLNLHSPPGSICIPIKCKVFVQICEHLALVWSRGLKNCLLLLNLEKRCKISSLKS